MRLVQTEQTKIALGGEVTIGLVLPDSVDTDYVFATLWAHTFQFERQFSRFLPESELSRFNAQAGLKVAISPSFHAVLQTASKLSKETDGLMNPFVLPAVQRAGYIHSALADYASDSAPDFRERSVVAPEQLEVHKDWARIPYGTAIDIGGFGKGYLADALGVTARKHGALGYWINASGDIAVFGTTADGLPIHIAVQSAYTNPTKSYRVVCPEAPSGIATSGTLRRVGHEAHSGHHIINPQTGEAAETDVVLATIHTSSALQADVLASCAVLTGSAKAEALLARHHASAYLLQLATHTYRQNGRSIIENKELAHG